MVVKSIMKMLEKAVAKKGKSQGAEVAKKSVESTKPKSDDLMSKIAEQAEKDRFMKGLKETEQKINKAEHMEARSAANKAESDTGTYAFGDGRIVNASRLPQQVAEDNSAVVKQTIKDADTQALDKAIMKKRANDNAVNTERDAKAAFIKAGAYNETKNPAFAKSYGETTKENAKKTLEEGKEFEKIFLEAMKKIKK